MSLYEILFERFILKEFNNFLDIEFVFHYLLFVIYLLLSLFNTFIFSYICFEEIFYILASRIIFVTSVVNFIYTNIGEIFFTSINFSFIVSLFLNLPIIYLHIWYITNK